MAGVVAPAPFAAQPFETFFRDQRHRDESSGPAIPVPVSFASRSSEYHEEREALRGADPTLLPGLQSVRQAVSGRHRSASPEQEQSQREQGKDCRDPEDRHESSRPSSFPSPCRRSSSDTYPSSVPSVTPVHHPVHAFLLLIVHHRARPQSDGGDDDWPPPTSQQRP